VDSKKHVTSKPPTPTPIYLFLIPKPKPNQTQTKLKPKPNPICNLRLIWNIQSILMGFCTSYPYLSSIPIFVFVSQINGLGIGFNFFYEHIDGLGFLRIESGD